MTGSRIPLLPFSKSSRARRRCLNLAILALLASNALSQLTMWGDTVQHQQDYPSGLKGIVKVDAGDYQTVALMADGTLRVWGSPNFNELVLPANLDHVADISAGEYACVYRLTNGTLGGFGSDFYGALTFPPSLANVVGMSFAFHHTLVLKGDGTVAAFGYNQSGSCDVPLGLDNVIAVSAGAIHSMALKADGTVVCWGDNTIGQCTVPTGLDHVVAIAATYTNSYALKSDGTVVSWGSGIYAPPALDHIISIDGHLYGGIGLKADGTVTAWGDNTYGQLTIPAGLSNVQSIAAGSSHFAAYSAETSPVMWGQNTDGRATPPANLIAKQLAAGGFHTLALKPDGTVVGWGLNSSGQTTIPSMGPVAQVAAGWLHSVARLADGTVKAWGSNGSGQTNVPSGLADVKQISTSPGGSFNLALKSDGTLVGWGDNLFSEVSSLPALTNVKQIAAGAYHGLALLADGTVVAWGRNLEGQCTVPSGLANVVEISAGQFNSVARKADGTVVAWGSNTSHESDINGATDIASLGGGSQFSSARTHDGLARQWGNSYNGLGVIPVWLSGVTQVAGGATHMGVLTAQPTGISSFSLTSTYLVGGQQTSGVIRLNQAAGVGGLAVQVSTPDGSVNPVTVNFPSGTSAKSFTLKATPRDSFATSPITASLGYSKRKIIGAFSPSSVAQFVMSPASVTGGVGTVGIVRLDYPAGPSGITVNLSSDSATATVPASVFIPAGGRAVSFAINTTPVDTDATANITADSGFGSATTALTVKAAVATTISGSTSVIGGTQRYYAVKLNGKAGPSGATVNLTTDSGSATPAVTSVVIPAGATYANFWLKTKGVDANTPVTLTASQGSTLATLGVTLTPATLANVGVSPSAVKGGYASYGVIRLNGAAGPSGVVAHLSSSDPSKVQVPSTLTLGANATAKSFQILTSKVTSTTTVTVTIYLDPASPKSFDITLNP